MLRSLCTHMVRAKECCPTLIAKVECCPQGQVALQDDLVLATLHVTYVPTSGSGGRPFTFNTAGLTVEHWVWRDRWVNLEGFVCGGTSGFGNYIERADERRRILNTLLAICLRQLVGHLNIKQCIQLHDSSRSSFGREICMRL